jgi:hypothetical protein
MAETARVKEIEVEKGAKIKIPGCKVKGGILPQKRIWS